MKKLDKLFAILIAVLGVGSLSAQTWTQSGEYYLYNESSKTFLSRGASWGTQAVTDKYGIPFAWDPALGSIKFLDSDAHLFITNDGHCFTDNNSTGWTCVTVNESTCRLMGTENRYLKQEADGVLTLTTTASEAVAWTFKTPAERNAIVATYPMENYAAVIQKAGLTIQSSEFVAYVNGNNYARKDMTSTIGTAKFNGNIGSWTWIQTREQKDQPAYGTNFAEVYQATGAYSQKISNLPSGIYKLTVNGFHRQGSWEKCNNLNNRGYLLSTATLRGNDQAVALKPWVTERTGEKNPDNTGEAVAAFNAGKYYNEVYVYVAEDGILDISVNIKNHLGGAWVLFNNFTLTYYSDQVSEEDATTLLTKIPDTETLPSAVAENLNVIRKTFESNKTISNYNTLASAIESSNELIAPYALLKQLIDLCNTYADENFSNVATSEVRTTFTTAITSAENNGNAATTVEALEEVYSTLEAARQAYVKAAIPTTGNRFDMTFLMTNPQVTSANGWTNGGTAVDQQYTGAPDNTYLDFYEVTRDMYQTLSGLPSGSYFVKAATRGHADVTVGYIYVQNGENKITADIHKVGNEGNTLGRGWDWTTTNAIAVTDGQLTIGFYAECGSGQWVGADVFSLYRAYDESLAAPMQASVTSLKSEAEALVDEIMSAKTKEALTTAINGADASSTNPFALDAMIVALSSAIAEAQTSIADYEKIATYIAKADGIDTSIAAIYKAQYENRTLVGDAVTIFQNLEVATYNYVKENFPYEVALSHTWNSTGTNTSAKEFYNEHWSGETRGYMNQNDDNGQGWNANAWSLDFDQDVPLPAGEYVFKVAGRKSAGTTLELVVTMGETELGTVNDFPASNNAKGINKAGVTSFDPEDAGFANNGNGFGWQWRYVKFTLNAESTVKVAVHAEANSHGQWVSFGDYTLQMTEDTYLEANKGGLDAPTAAANLLVDTKPMGTAENNALKEALAMTYTTGQQLLDKIKALNTAVANAESWVVKYNNAKAPLVAALDRFEVDYNKAENGALNHMNKSRWETAISMAQAAAVAKDVTNSYDGFETATNNLNKALDAATISVNEYAALNSAIENADTLANGGNWGDQPFQRPISAKESLNTTTAQDTYDAADADGEGVTSVTAALNENIEAADAIVLNAPTEGQRYYIKVATEGHGKKDNAWLVTLGDTGGNNPTGYGINANNMVKGHLNQAFIFTQVEGNLYNISIERAEGTVYLTYGTLNGSAAGWKNQQIQATTNAENKGQFKIVPTGKNGILKIFNTIDNHYLDCQDKGSIYTDTGIENEEFAFELATETEVTLTIPEERWTTLILPFDAELPENVKAYSCSEVKNNVLTLVEAESLKANTPYLVNGYENDYYFSGYGLADEDSYTDGLFTGTYVKYQTTANSNTYVLQNVNSELGFYLVGENERPAVDAYYCYITYEAQEGEEQASMFLLSGGQGDDPTAIEDTGHKAQGEVLVYDLMGRKVTTMEKGKFYIVNGVKVIIK